jgi:hypothetical protein
MKRGLRRDTAGGVGGGGELLVRRNAPMKRGLRLAVFDLADFRAS